MLDKIKFGLVVWVTIFLVICFFVIIGFGALCLLWWVVTNNMIDRNLFLLISLGVSKLISCGLLGLSLLPEKNKNTLSI
tara:strand:+ start:275 stop:511 length:237 start_codon:yes stop_codon:yes gene_type:complete